MTEDPRAYIAGLFDRASSTYDAVGVDYFGVIAQYLLEDVDLQPGEMVLDVGCGRGAVLFRAAEAVGAEGHLTGIDLAPGMVEATRRDIAARGLMNADVRLADAQQPALADASYDVVLASLSLFFLPRPPDALAAYRRALKPGGRIGFTTFAGKDPRWAWFEDVRRELLPDLKPPGGEHFASDESIDGLLAGAGFVDVSHRAYGFDTHFTTAEHWWKWSWSQTLRAAWERMDAATMETARSRINAGIAEISAPDGSLSYHQPIRVTTAVSA
jgi:ubiquinone/menaquinone biosynthesis C-methylase UbiE